MAASAAMLMVGIGADTSDLERGMAKSNSLVQGFSNLISRAAENATRLFIINTIMGAVSSAVEFATDAVFTFNASLEQSTIAFTQFTGSVDMAKDVLKELAVFAANTPFEYESVIKTARSFMALGLSMENIRPLQQSIADGIATFGKGSAEIDRVTLALTQMITKGRVMAQEMNQLSEAGIGAPWAILAEHLNKTTGEVQKLAEAGKIGADEFIIAFEKFAQTHWADAAAKQMATFNGALTTINDNVKIAISEAFQPLFEYASRATVAFAEFTKSDAFQTWAGELGGAVTVVGQGFQILADIFSTSLSAILDITITIGQAIYEALSWLNPFATHSPSLVSQVADGTNEIMRSYAQLGSTVPNLMDAASSAVQKFQELAGPGMANAAKQADAELRKTIGYLGGAAISAYFTARDAVAALNVELQRLEKEISDQERVLKMMEVALRPLQKSLDETRSALARVGQELSDAKAKLEEFLKAPLTGQAAFEDAMFAAEKATNQLQLAIINFKLGSGLSDARDRVESIRNALEDARAEYAKFATATLEGSKAYSDALFANEMATKQLQLQLANLKSDALKKVADIAKQFDERIQSNKDRVIALSASIQSIKDGALAKVNDRVDKLKADITSAHAAFDKFVNAQLVGSKEYEDQLFANEQAIAKVKLAINELKQAQAGSEGNSALTALQNQLDQIEIRRKELQAQLLDLTTAGATKDSPAIKALEKSMDEAALAALNTQIAIDKINASGGDDNAAMEALLKQLDALQLAGENIDLKKQLDLDPQYRKLKEITQTQEELTFADAIAGAERAKAQIDLFGGELSQAEQEQSGLNAQISEMEKLIKGITSETDKLELEKKLAVDAAMAPLQAIEDQISKLAVEAEKIRLREFLDLEPQRRAIEELLNTSQEMTFEEIRDGILRSRDNVDHLTDSLRGAENVVKSKEAELAKMEAQLERIRLEAQKIELERWMQTAETERNIAKIAQSFNEMSPEEKAAAVTHWVEEVARLTGEHRNANMAVEEAQRLVDEQNQKIETQRDLVSGLKDEYEFARDSVKLMTDELKAAETAAKSLESAAKAAAKAAKGGGGEGATKFDPSKLPKGGAPTIDTTSVDAAKRVIEDWRKKLEEARDAVDNFKKSIEYWKNEINKSVTDVKNKAIPILKAIGDGFKAVFGTDFEGALKKGTKLIDETFDNIQFLFDSFIAGFKDTWDTGWRRVFSNTTFSDVLNMITAVTETITRTWLEMFTFIYNYFNENIQQFAYIFERLGVLIAAVTIVAIAAIVQLWKSHGEDIAKIFTGFFDILKAVTSVGLDLIIGLVAIAMGLLTGDFSGAVDAGKRMFDNLWKHLGDVFNGIGKVISGFVGFFKDDIERWLATSKAQFDNFYNFWVVGTGKFVEFMLNGFKNMWNNLIVEMARWVKETGEKFTAFDLAVKEKLTRTFAEAWDAVVKWVTDTVEKFQTWVNETSKKNEEWKDSIIKNITDGIKGAWDGIVKFVADAIQKFKDWVTSGIEQFIAWKDNLIRFVTEGATQTLEGIKTWIGETLGKLNEWATNVDKEVGAKWKTFVDNILNAIKTLATDLWGAVYSNEDSIYNKMKTAWGNVVKAVMDYITGPEGLVNKAKAGFQAVIDGIVDGPLKNAFDRLTDPFKRALARIQDLIAAMRDAWNHRPGIGGGDAPTEGGGGGEGGGAPTGGGGGGSTVSSIDENIGPKAPKIYVPATNGMLPTSANGGATYAGPQTATIIIELDGRQIAKTVAPLMVEMIRGRTGIKI